MSVVRDSNYKCRPDAVENEEELNEDAAEWQNAAHQHSRH